LHKASSTEQPRHPEIGVIALVPDRWGTIWQPRHHVLSRLTRFFPVVWVEPHLSWGEWSAVSRRPAVDEQATPKPRHLHVLRSTPWLPKFYRPDWLGDLALRTRLGLARRRLRQRGCEKIVLYLWRPDFEPALDAVRHELSCYHIDDEYSFSSVEKPLDRREERVIRSAGQVFIHSPALLAKKGKLNPNTTFVPNGVDYRAYSAPVAEPVDLASIPRPRVGYTGHVKKQLDWRLIAALVEARPAWQFVFVGNHDSAPETKAAVARLEPRENVHFLGAKTVWELAAYPQHFDVCIMPYRRDDYTKFIYPMKLHEYLASGRPVVGTRIQSLEEFGQLVALPEHDDEWRDAIEQALDTESRCEQAVEQRRSVARRHDWALHVERVAAAMLERLGSGDPHYPCLDGAGE
jgi:glycosyltransferase involved in cell wall biosynthesis